MSDRLRRFLHLERARPARPDAAPADPTPATAERFGAVQRPTGRGPQAASRTGAELERFGPEPEPSLELLDTDGRRPFNRCLRCGMDANVLAATCPNCNASLDTAEVRAFNERLWARLQTERAREEAANAGPRAAQGAAAAEAARAKRAMAETLAREVGAQERRRLARELGGVWDPWWSQRRGSRFHLLDLVEWLFELLFW